VNRIDEITLLAERCKQTDYAIPASVNEHNAAADQIRELIAAITADEELLALLAGGLTRGWAAFQLLEQPERLSPPVRHSAVDVLREIALLGGTDGLAAQWRLRELGAVSK